MDEAADAGIPVISYDRLIKSDAVSYYISFDNYTVGTLQGQYVVDTLDLDNAGDKTYNIEFTAGDPADNNAGYFFNGAFDVLKPYIDAGTLNVVFPDRLILILLQHLHGIPRQHLKECRIFWHPTMQTEHSLT